jgi:flagellar basal-body rod protein FlgF
MYMIGAGLNALTDRVDSIAANLANANTPGYRRQTADVHLFETHLDPSPDSPVVRVPGVRTGIDLRAGRLEDTGNDLDFAIQGRGFFAIRTPEGTGYTRAGRFTLNERGEIATSAGHPVLGQSGPIVVGNGSDLAVAPDGTVSVDGAVAGRIRLADFLRPDRLRHGEDGLFVAPPDAVEEPVRAPRIRQGALEGSNVDATTEMVELIEAQRSYDRKHRAISVLNDAMEKLTRLAQGL